MDARTLLLSCCLGGCSLSPDLAHSAPPLADMEEPLDLRAEPDDEAARQKLPPGSFSGLVVDDGRDTLADKLDQPGTLRIASVVENSPAAAAGLQPGDLLLEARIAPGPTRALQRPSEWRQIELDHPPGTRVALVIDRAGREARSELLLVARVRPAARSAAEQFREEQRVGVVLRTATEVEARAAGLGPGAGAVVVGLSRGSPWRAPGIRFGDVLVAVDGLPLTHPQQLLARLRDENCDRLRLDVVRGGERRTVDAPLSQRDDDVSEVWVPPLLYWGTDRGKTEFSMLLGLVNHQSTAAAWRFRLLWIFAIGGGDSDRLLEVDG